MKNFISQLALALFLISPALSTLVKADAAPRNSLRLIETSTVFGKLLLQKFPGQIKFQTRIDRNHVVLLIPKALIPTASQLLHRHTGRCGGFIDITTERLSPRTSRFEDLLSFEDLPPLGNKQEPIVRAIQTVKGENIERFVKDISTQFKTRLASSTDGEQAGLWLQKGWQKMADHFGRADVKVELIPPPQGYKQSSVRITIPGTDLKRPYVILGGHLDSINQQFGRNTSAPGADDDASGIGALTETYNALLKADFRPKATIQIFAYSAEEVGLVGSRVIAEKYAKEKIPVRAVMQLDMVAFPGEKRTMTFIRDNTKAALSVWTEQVYGLYIGGNIQEERCGYGCSDHASWNRFGYPAVLPFESKMNEMNSRIHTSKDLWDQFLDAQYAAQFTKLAVAFAWLLSE